MRPGEVVELEPGQVAASIAEPMRQAPLADVLEFLRFQVIAREAEQRPTYSDQCIARLLSHVGALHSMLIELGELTADDLFSSSLENRHAITRLVHSHLACIGLPKD